MPSDKSEMWSLIGFGIMILLVCIGVGSCYYLAGMTPPRG